MTRIRVLWLSAFVKDVRIPETEAEMGRECQGLQVGGGGGAGRATACAALDSVRSSSLEFTAVVGFANSRSRLGLQLHWFVVVMDLLRLRGRYVCESWFVTIWS